MPGMKRREFMTGAAVGLLAATQAGLAAGRGGSKSSEAAGGFLSEGELRDLDIWDSYFTAAHSNPGPQGDILLAEIEAALAKLAPFHFRRLCYFAHVGLGTTSASIDAWLKANPKAVEEPLKRWPDRLIGMIQLNPNDVRGSLDALDRWLGDGPMTGVYFSGGSAASLPCSHSNYEPLVKRIAELKGVIMQHTWFITGGKPRPTMSTPDELAQLASRFPEIEFICAHAGGEWEKGIRAIRGHRNILAETSGFDPTAGFVEMAVRELGAERVVFGSHAPSRSLGTELSKVLAAQITDRDKKRIMGANYRRLLAPIMKLKGMG